MRDTRIYRSLAQNLGWWLSAFLVIVLLLAGAGTIGMTAGTMFSDNQQLGEGIATPVGTF